MNKEMTVREAGRIGGLIVKAKYGLRYYAEIGKKGGDKTAKRGPAFYSEMGKIGGNVVKKKYGAKHFVRIGKMKKGTGMQR